MSENAAILEPDAFVSAVPLGRRLLGLDVGTKTIGLAVSDPDWLLASPLETIRRRRWQEDVARLQEIIAQWRIGGLVCGLPLVEKGGDGRRAQGVRQVARNLVAALQLPLVFEDERFSTQEVERMLIEEVDMTRRRRALLIDKLAARHILQGALDRLRPLSKGTSRSPTSDDR
ncbi:MAG: Holliday junction resolvase RuvX [Alphaproteobacteria bacterium]|nr:MAG: Holliday junction resolvase RuvX [Alphaproteobacteria bacterium]